MKCLIRHKWRFLDVEPYIDVPHGYVGSTKARYMCDRCGATRVKRFPGQMPSVEFVARLRKSSPLVEAG